MSKSLARTSMLVTILMVIGYVISFLKEVVIANYFGISGAVDAYTIAITIPVTLFAVISVSIQSIVVPLYSDILVNGGEEEARVYINKLITLVGCVAVFFIFLCEVLASPLIYLFAPGFEPEIHSLASSLLRITLPTILFTVLDRVFVGVLNVHRKFVFPTLSLYVLNFILILFIVLLHAEWGITAACVGQVIGSIGQVLFLFIVVHRYIHFRLDFRWKGDDAIKKSMKNSVPIIWTVSLGEVSAIINRMVSSFLFVGSISAISYALKINSVLMQFFTTAIATIVYPLYAESAARKDLTQLNGRVNSTLSIYIFFLLPLMCGILCLKQEVITVAFGRGAFDSDAITLTQQLLGLYCIGITFSAIRETTTKVFYSLQDTTTPAKNTTLGLILTIAFNLTLPLVFGIYGLAIAKSLVAIIISTRLLWELVRKHDEINIGFVKANLPGIVIPSFIMLAVVLLARYIWPIESALVSLLVFTIIGVVTYGLCCILFRPPVMFDILKMTLGDSYSKVEKLITKNHTAK